MIIYLVLRHVRKKRKTAHANVQVKLEPDDEEVPNHLHQHRAVERQWSRNDIESVKQEIDSSSSSSSSSSDENENEHEASSSSEE